jgi:glycosyltransferase involved in cell wall biosynthesis
VRSQTFTDYEIIIVDDGSTDTQTQNVLNELAGCGIQVMRTSNKGPAVARNYGIRLARGSYILPLDADDKIAPCFLERAVDILDGDPLVGAVYGKVEFFGETTGEWVQPDYSPTRILFDNMIVASTVFRRSDWLLIGGYRPNMRHGWEDWDFWLSFVELGRKVVKLPTVVFYYRILKDSRTRSLSLIRKFRLFLQLVCNHKRLYIANGRTLLGILLKNMRTSFFSSQNQAL